MRIDETRIYQAPRAPGRTPGAYRRKLCIKCLSENCAHIRPESGHLTPRLIAVLNFLAQGASNKDIGRRLNLTENSVKMYVSKLFKALKVDSRLQCALWARDHAEALNLSIPPHK